MHSRSIHLSVTDVSVDHLRNPTVLFIRMKQSKTDQLHCKTDQTLLCPVSAMIGVSAMLGYLVMKKYGAWSSLQVD